MVKNFEHLKELMEFVGNITHHSSWDRWGNCCAEWTSEIPFKSMEELEEAYQKHKKRKQEYWNHFNTVKNSFAFIYRGLVRAKYGYFVPSGSDSELFRR